MGQWSNIVTISVIRKVSTGLITNVAPWKSIYLEAYVQVICWIEHYLQNTLALKNRKWRLFYFNRRKKYIHFSRYNLYLLSSWSAKENCHLHAYFSNFVYSKSVKVNLNTYFCPLLSERHKQNYQTFHHQVGKEDSLAWVQARARQEENHLDWLI